MSLHCGLQNPGSRNAKMALKKKIKQIRVCQNVFWDGWKID